MKIEIDTINDSVEELKKTILLIQDSLERRTGITSDNFKAPLRPSEFRYEEPKIIFEDLLSTKPSKKTNSPYLKDNQEPIKKRKVLKQDEHEKEEEEEDEDRKLPQIQYRDYW